MEKLRKYSVPILLFAWASSLFCIDLIAIRRESVLFDLSAAGVAEVGEHYHRKFYETTDCTAASEHSGEVAKKWGLMGGISEVGTLSAQEGCQVNLSVQSRRGEAGFVLCNQETGDIYDARNEETLTLPQGEYRVLCAGNRFSGTCALTFDGGSFALPDE